MLEKPLAYTEVLIFFKLVIIIFFKLVSTTGLFSQ